MRAKYSCQAKGPEKNVMTPRQSGSRTDGVQGYLLENLTSLHRSITQKKGKTINSKEVLQAWMRRSRRVLRQKDPHKRNEEANFRSISCLLVIWKSLSVISNRI